MLSLAKKLSAGRKGLVFVTSFRPRVHEQKVCQLGWASLRRIIFHASPPGRDLTPTPRTRQTSAAAIPTFDPWPAPRIALVAPVVAPVRHAS